MTPEALRDYLVGRGFTEDVAQDVVVSYLTTKSTVRDPRLWGLKAACNLVGRYAHGPSPSWGKVSSLSVPLPAKPLVGREADPLRTAIGREELATLFAKPKHPRLKHSKILGGWVHGGGYTACLKDYLALLSEPK